jgi:DNA-binding CsgD family transcriptional regulator
LTATERQVAELAAAGLRTRSIAEIAFLSPKTVGNVLGRAYQKLGIHSRAELGALMAREERILTGEALPTDDQLQGRARSIRGHRSG